MKNILIVGILVIMIGVGIALYMRNGSNPANESTATQTPQESSSVTPETSSSPVSAAAVKEFVVIGTNYSFGPKTIMVNKGDRVKILFKNNGGFHDLVIEGLNVATKRINQGGMDTVEFTASVAGSFEYYCSVGDHRQQGMFGTLIVQ
ncbi:MAG: cupredoxin domain-containing protein [bacterium]|nr:cupredoxin domain-containing protein [bacterium]MDZ4286174.1 cupredoxin domain-containing protein [Candidatus Sungbacteria bacterium]